MRAEARTETVEEVSVVVVLARAIVVAVEMAAVEAAVAARGASMAAVVDAAARLPASLVEQ